MSKNNSIVLLLLASFLTLSLSVEILSTSYNLMGSHQGTQIIDNPLLRIAAPLIKLNPLASECKLFEVQNHQNVCIKPHYIEGCQQYQTSSACYKCSSGYILNKNKLCDFQPSFTGVINHIKGCIKQSDSACQVCGEGFYMKEGKCHLGIKNCAQYDNYGECTECEQDFSLILSQCRRNSLLGCKYETESHTCQQCYPPFTLNGQHCDIEQCRVLNDYGCVSCECGFYLTPERDCKPIAPGCLRYEKGVCKDCLPHYKLKGSVCQIQGCVQYTGNYCKKCSDKYQLIDGQCSFKNCMDWLNDQCFICKEGFGLRDGICVQANPVKCQ